MRALQSKLPSAGTTIFTVMSQLAAAHNAVNLGQGFPDFPMSEALTSLVNQAMQGGHNQYAHMNGLLLLRQKIAEKIALLYAQNVDPETDITITPGGTYAIYTALTTVLQPGDEVIVFEPAYDSYVPNILINGAVPIRISLSYPGFEIPWQEVKTKISARTRMIMVNSPHNPTGKVLNDNDIQQLQAITYGTDILILSDEVYEHLIFDGLSHASILRYPELRKRSFVCFSFGKTYHCTGWKLGYCIAPPALMAEFRKVHQYNAFSCNTPVQVALAEYLNNQPAYLELGAFFEQKRNIFRRLMERTPFKPLDSHGGYFECYSYDKVTTEPDHELAIRLTQQYGVACIPLSAFYVQPPDLKVLRFCFAKKQETLLKAAERLSSFQY